MKKKIVFVINLTSGTSDKTSIPPLIDEHLDKDKFEYEIVTTEYAGHASEISAKAKNDGVDIVVAVGGDGTVNEVARSIVHSGTALGIIPCGSGNGLARHLLLPMNTRKAIEIINACEIHELDYGVINEYPFFCTCGMGFDAFVSMKFAESGKRGPITYAENILRDAYIAPQASMSDGLMDVIIMEPFDMLEAPQISIDMFNKTLDKNTRIKTFHSKKIHIHRTKPGVIHYDGDPVMAGEDINVEIKEKGIKIIINPYANKNMRKPNALQNVLSEIFNEINSMREDIAKHREATYRFMGKSQRKEE